MRPKAHGFGKKHPLHLYTTYTIIIMSRIIVLNLPTPAPVFSTNSAWVRVM